MWTDLARLRRIVYRDYKRGLVDLGSALIAAASSRVDHYETAAIRIANVCVGNHEQR